MESSRTVAFRGTAYALPPPKGDLSHVEGPWRGGRKTFRRRAEETAEQFAQRIESDAVASEVLPSRCRLPARGRAR